jgi:hypothetical protein
LNKQALSKKLLLHIILGLSLLVIGGLSISCRENSEESPLPSIVQNAQSPVSSVNLNNYKIANNEPDPDGVTLVSVGFAAENSMISVTYSAPPELAKYWNPGDVFVVEENSGKVYRNTVLMPVVGWLFQKPQNLYQSVSVMLTNEGLQSGDGVTVVLGKYKRLHYKIP